MNLTLHLTDACSMRCRYCYAPPGVGLQMSLETGLAALDFALRQNGDEPCGIVFFGGEPLLCKPLIREIVEEGQRRSEGRARLHWKVTTNGLLLDEPFLRWANEVKLLVAISIDGTREIHDRHRLSSDGSPTFDRLLPILRLLLRYQPHATVFSVVNPDTAHGLADSVSFLLDQGVRYIVVSLNYGADWDEEQLAILVEQYRILGERYLEWTRAGRKFYVSPLEMAIATHVAGERAGVYRCDMGKRQLSVDTEGWLYPCVQFPRAGPKWRIGDVRSGLDRHTRDQLNEQANRPASTCRECAIEARCPRTCACLNHQGTGQIDMVPPLLCHTQQALISVADRVASTLWAEKAPLFLQKHYNQAWPVLSLLDDYNFMVR